MNKQEWKDQAVCLDYDTNLFFDKYEEDELLRPAIDKLCFDCPVRKNVFLLVFQVKSGVFGVGFFRKWRNI